MRACICIPLMMLPALFLAQTSDLGNWLIYFGNHQMSERWNLHHEVQYRNYNFIGDTEQLLLRAGIGYNLSPQNNNLLLGYGFIHGQNYVQDTDEKVKTDEHRIFQQLITRQRFGRVHAQHRYRLEQRFISSDFRLRFRYFLAVNVPLTRSEMADHTLYASAYNEVFLNTEGSVFDRNRVYLGIGYRFSALFRCEAGYMNQLFAGSRRDQINLITFVSF